jgi:hypothetical protein
VTESTFKERPPFFVVGSDRSGTTMLMMMLDAHPELGVSRESWFLIELMDALPLHGTLNRQQVDKAFEIIHQHPRWQRWNIPNEVLASRLDKLTDPDLADLIEAVFQLDLGRSQKTRWGDKTPAYVREIERIHSMFPQAKFIHIIRDARDVCISLKNVGWHGPTLRHMASYWRQEVISGIEAGRALKTNVYLEVPYEKLVMNTEVTLKQICSFLGEPFDASMLAWYDLTAEKTAERPMKFQTKLGRAPRPSDIGRWKNEMSSYEVAVVESYAGDAMDMACQHRRFAKIAGLIRPLFRALEIIRTIAGRVRRKLFGLRQE